MALDRGKSLALIGVFLLFAPAGASEHDLQPETPERGEVVRPQNSVLREQTTVPSRDVPAVEPAVGSSPQNGTPEPETPAAATGEEGMSGFGHLSFTSVDEPIVVEADRLEFDYEKNRLFYKGSVHVVQGNFELSSDTLAVTFQRTGDLERAELSEVVARGDVVITQQDRRASGRVAIFKQETRKIVMRGDPVLRDGANEIQGDRITVYLDEGRTVVDAAPRKRVSAVLYPGSDKGEVAGEASPSPEETGERP